MGVRGGGQTRGQPAFRCDAGQQDPHRIGKGQSDTGQSVTGLRLQVFVDADESETGGGPICNAVDCIRGRTLLHYAVRWDNQDLVRTLLQRGWSRRALALVVIFSVSRYINLVNFGCSRFGW